MQDQQLQRKLEQVDIMESQIYFVNKFLKSSNPDTKQFRKKD